MFIEWLLVKRNMLKITLVLYLKSTIGSTRMKTKALLLKDRDSKIDLQCQKPLKIYNQVVVWNDTIGR